MQQNLKEVYKYLRALHRYRYAAVVVALLIMTVIGGYSFTLPKKYQADSTVFIEKSVIDSLVRGIAITPNINDKIRVLRYALSSRDLIVKTLEELNSDIFTKPKAAQQSYIAGLKERTNISVRRNDLFIVSLIDTDPVFVYKYVNALVSKYLEENIASKRDEAYGANRFLDEQIDLFKDKLQAADDAIIEFRKKQGIYYSVDEGATIEEIKTFMQEIEEIELFIDTLYAKKNQLQGQLETLEPTVESVFSIDTGIAGDEGDPQLVAMKKRLSDLRLRYTDNYPEIIRLKYEMESLRKRLKSNVEPVGDPGASKMTSLNPLYLDVQQRLLEVQSEITARQSRKQNLQRQITKRENALNEVPEARKQLNVLIQERNSYQKIYQDLLSRVSQSEVSKQMEIGNKTTTFRIVDPAVMPENPVSPDLRKMLLLAIFAGVGAAVGLVFLLENLDSRIRDTEYFKELGVEVLAVVPNIAEPALIRRKRKRDMLFYTFSSAYALCFVGAFAFKIFL